MTAHPRSTAATRARAGPTSGPAGDAPPYSGRSAALPAATALTEVVRDGSVRFAVPAGWPVYDLAVRPHQCVRFDQHAVYLGRQGPAPACPAHAVGHTEAVQVTPFAAADWRGDPVGRSVDGQRALIDPGTGASAVLHAGLPALGVAVTIAYRGGPGLAEAILGSFRRAPGPDRPPVSGPASPRIARPVSGPAGGRLRAGALGTGTTTFNGLGFDTCAAPSTGAMHAWLASPYRAVGIYIGGINRACGPGNLSGSWVQYVQSIGWHLIPIYVGLQAPCVGQGGLAVINPSQANNEGIAAGADAARSAASFAVPQHSAIWFDMENYDSQDPSCSAAVVGFIGGWSYALTRAGYVPAMYGSPLDGLRDEAGELHNPFLSALQEAWFADWNGDPGVWNEPDVPNGDWTLSQRMHQYEGGHVESWGGAGLDIDSDGVAATMIGVPLAPPYRPAIGVNTNATVDLLAVSAGARLDGLSRCPTCPRWTAPAVLAGDPAAGSPSVTANSDGRLEAVVRQPDGSVLDVWQRWPGGPWGTSELGGWVAGDPLVVRWPSGELEVFALGFGNTVVHTWRLSGPTGYMWQPWKVLATGAASDLTAAINSRGVPQLFATDGAGHLVTTYFAGAWRPLGVIPGLPAVTGAPSAVANTDQRLEVALRESTGGLIHSWENASFGWQWGGLGSIPIAGDPALTRWPDGHLEVFATTSSQSVVHAWRYPDGQWSGLFPVGGSATGDLAVTSQRSNGAYVAGRTASGELSAAHWGPGWSGMQPIAGGF